MNDPIALLQQLVDLTTRLVDRLAPTKQQSTPILFDGVSTVPGYVLGPIKLTNPYNQFVVNLTQGTVLVYRNNYNPTGTTQQVPDFTLNPTDNPLPIPMGLLNDTQLYFVVSKSSSGNAKGTVYINRY